MVKVDDSASGVPRWLLGVTTLAVIVVPLMILTDPFGRRAGATSAVADPAAGPLPPPVEQPTPSATSTVSITEVRAGAGAKAGSGDTVKVHYIGTLADGTQFDSSRDRGEPLRLQLGQGQVIKGLEQAVIGMRAGGQRHVAIPQDLAYGESGAPPRIPPRATLNFELELVAIE